MDVDVRAGPEAAAAAREATAAVRAEIPRIVASARAAVHPHEIQAALREAEAEMREAGRLSQIEIESAMRGARFALAAADARVRVVTQVQIDEAMRRAEQARARAHEQVRFSMRHGAEGMEQGADRMMDGAARMETTARRLASDPAYRERQIAEARERGETVTHEQLIEAAEEMQEGAQGMREGAREMRRSAQRMRAGGD